MRLRHELRRVSMAWERQLRAKLDRLEIEGGLPWSAVSRRLLDAVQSLVACGVLIEERAGAGRRLRVRDRAALVEFRRSRFPLDEMPGGGRESLENSSLNPGVGARVEGVGRYRDSKVVGGPGTDLLMLRVWRDGMLRDAHGPVLARQATQRFGVFALALGQQGVSAGVTLEGEFGIVENPTVFMVFERLGSGCGAAIYGGGRLPGRVLDWLVEQSAERCRFRHFPDYDPVGLSEYGRLRARLAGRISLHLPTDLAERFQRFSNPRLLRNRPAQVLLGKALESAVPEVAQVAALISARGGGLEQEALLL